MRKIGLIFGIALAACVGFISPASSRYHHSYPGEGLYASGWYPGKGQDFCQAYPGNWRCNRGKRYGYSYHPRYSSGFYRYGYSRDWYPGKGQDFCQARPWDRRCNR